MFEFVLPDLGEGLTEAEVGVWLVAVGDTVTEDQPVVEVQTAKAMVEIPSPVAGVVAALGGAPGEMIAVGSMLMTFNVADASRSSMARDGFAVPTSQSRPPVGESDSGDAAAPVVLPATGRVAFAAPSTRRYARELGVDLASTPGSGPGGRVIRADVDRAQRGGHPASADAAPTTSTPDRSPTVVPLRGIRRQMAYAMTRSWTDIPHVTEFRELDATNLVEARRLFLRHEPDVALTFLPFVIVAVADALSRHPAMNASIDMNNETVSYAEEISIGVATSSDDGLVVPVVRNADRLGLLDVRSRIEALLAAVRDRTVRAEDLVGDTFVVSNFGSYGTWLGTPIIRAPHTGIAGFGRIRDRVVALDGEPVVRPMLPIAVAADHRLVDGHMLGAFVNDLAALLESPMLLLARAR